MKCPLKHIIPGMLVFWFALGLTLPIKAQNQSINFHKLDISNGLNDGIVRCIAQDQFGYIWIGTVGAVNRFDGTGITQFTYLPNDTTSINSSQPRCFHSDSTGRFWIGTETGLMEYDFAKNSFKHYKTLHGVYISFIESIDRNNLLIVSRSNIYKFNKTSQQLFHFNESNQAEHSATKQLSFNGIDKIGNQIFLATNTGLVQYDCLGNSFKKIDRADIGNRNISLIEADNEDHIWLYMGVENKLIQYRFEPTKKTINENAQITNPVPDSIQAIGLIADNQQKLWLATRSNGLFSLNKRNNTYTQYKHNLLIPSGPSSNSYRFMYKDKDNIIWLACDVEGVNYFRPEENLFKSLLAFPDDIQRQSSRLGRAITVDKNNNVWMGNHDGLSRYNPVSGEYTVWRNQSNKLNVLYNNIIRSLCCDKENNIWIGTGSGVNKYNSVTNEMEFITDKNLPLSWYNSINEDKSGNVWFCTNDTASLYWYSSGEKKFHSIAEHPSLKKYVRFTPTSYLFEDSKQRIWISFSRKGLVMFDKNSNQLTHYKARENDLNGIIGNQIVDIAEDRTGIIWVSTFNGITGINVEKNTFQSFNSQSGFPSNISPAIAIDSLNRIWVGVNGALTMIEADRKTMHHFSTADGLPSVGFHEHASCTAPNGVIWMPTYNGYFSFNPAAYRKVNFQLPFYVSHYSIFDKDEFRINPSENSPTIQLQAKQNSFTFNLVALNFLNPGNTWFAYKLTGFENNWHYTKDPKAVFTNVPGGNYTFEYKASVSNANWEKIQAKSITIRLATIFYKTIWFKAFLILMTISFVSILYQYRSKQQMRLFALTEKAQALEKDKAMIMYESLKQQLNPHFLFNSLSSLKSLIKINPKDANTFLENLSKSYRYILKSRDNETTLLSEEVKFAESYVALHKSRYNQGFEVYFNIQEEDLQYKIVPVTLQNLVENAMKHNIIDSNNPLVVEIYSKDQFLYVRNNLQKKKIVETSNKQGLAQLKAFYTYLSPHPLEVIETVNYFEVKIPLL